MDKPTYTILELVNIIENCTTLSELEIVVDVISEEFELYSELQRGFIYNLIYSRKLRISYFETH